MEKDTTPDQGSTPDQDKPVEDSVKNPETVNPAPESAPAPANPSGVETIVQELTKRVGELETIVGAITQTADTTPVKKPWTHRKLFGR